MKVYNKTCYLNKAGIDPLTPTTPSPNQGYFTHLFCLIFAARPKSATTVLRPPSLCLWMRQFCSRKQHTRLLVETVISPSKHFKYCFLEKMIANTALPSPPSLLPLPPFSFSTFSETALVSSSNKVFALHFPTSESLKKILLLVQRPHSHQTGHFGLLG